MSSKNARKEILEILVKAWAADSSTQVIDPPNYVMIMVHAEGYAPIDLQPLMKRVVQRAASRALELARKHLYHWKSRVEHLQKTPVQLGDSIIPHLLDLCTCSLPHI